MILFFREIEKIIQNYTKTSELGLIAVQNDFQIFELGLITVQNDPQIFELCLIAVQIGLALLPCTSVARNSPFLKVSRKSTDFSVYP